MTIDEDSLIQYRTTGQSNLSGPGVAVDYRHTAERLAAVLGRHTDAIVEELRRLREQLNTTAVAVNEFGHVFTIDEVTFTDPKRRKKAQWKNEPKRHGPQRRR
jgi:hypothetical protein